MIPMMERHRPTTHDRKNPRHGAPSDIYLAPWSAYIKEAHVCVSVLGLFCVCGPERTRRKDEEEEEGRVPE
jgi:hypothetical protein